MGRPVRSKKMAILEHPRKYLRRLDISNGKWSASTLLQIEFSRWARARLLLGLGPRGSGPAIPKIRAAQPARPSRAQALIVGESEAIAVDRDEVFLIEDWRLRPDGSAIAPGVNPKDATPIYTINGLAMLDIPARIHERLRLRFINGCQRSVI